MPVVLLLLCLTAPTAAQSLLCDPDGPDQALADALSVCRGLDYGFCVDRGLSSTQELSQLAVRKDADLAAAYRQVSATQSQRCVYAWINMVCSATFPLSRTGAAEVCEDVCDEVRRHCVGVQCVGEGAPPRCTDFYDETRAVRGQCTTDDDDGSGDGVPVLPPRVPLPPRSPGPRVASSACQFRDFRFAAGLLALVVFAGFI